MNLKFLNKVQTPDMIEIKIKKVFDEATDNFGNASKNCIVDWDGKEYYAKFKEKYYDIAVAGNKVSAVRKLYKGSAYHEYYSGGDGLTPNPKLESPPPKNAHGRGAAFNLAFHWCLANKANYPTLEDMLKDVKLYAQQIAPHQSEFVNE